MKYYDNKRCFFCGKFITEKKRHPKSPKKDAISTHVSCLEKDMNEWERDRYLKRSPMGQRVLKVTRVMRDYDINLFYD
jgi:hypothetical protein